MKSQTSLVTVLAELRRAFRGRGMDWLVPSPARGVKLQPRLAQRLADVLERRIPVRVTTRRSGSGSISYRDGRRPPRVGLSGEAYRAAAFPSLVIPCQEGVVEFVPPQQHYSVWRGHYTSLLPFDTVKDGLGDFVVDGEDGSAFVLEDVRIELQGVSCTLSDLVTDTASNVYGSLLRSGIGCAGLDADDEDVGEYLHGLVSRFCEKEIRGAIARRDLPAPRVAELALNFPKAKHGKTPRARVYLRSDQDNCRLEVRASETSGMALLPPLREVANRLYRFNGGAHHSDAQILKQLRVSL